MNATVAFVLAIVVVAPMLGLIDGFHDSANSSVTVVVQAFT